MLLYVQYIAFEVSTCLANVVIGTVVTFKFLNTCGLCFSCMVLCVVLFVRCLLRVLFVVYAMLYSSFFYSFSSFVCGFVVMS